MTEVLFSGGPIGVAILGGLVALSLAMVYLVVDLFLTLRRDVVQPPTLAEEVRQALIAGKLAEADAATKRHPSVAATVTAAGMRELEFGYAAVEKAVEDALGSESARLGRRTEYLALIAAVAPMLGLLGTVTGMILAFGEVAASDGDAGAGELARGIYQALVTTVGGLIVAIPATAAYAVFRNRIEGMLADVAGETQIALAPVKRKLGGRGKAVN